MALWHNGMFGVFVCMCVLVCVSALLWSVVCKLDTLTNWLSRLSFL